MESSTGVSGISAEIIIAELAGAAFQFMHKTLTPAAFEEKSLKFSNRIKVTKDDQDDGNGSGARLRRVLQVMALDECDWDFELGYSWLAANGYGDMNVNWLGKMLSERRQALLP